MLTLRQVDANGDTSVVLDGLGFPESTRWRDGRVSLCNWGAGEVLAVAPDLAFLAHGRRPEPD